MDIDILLSLIELTKSKYKILEKMLVLEFYNDTNKNNYIELLNSYKLVCEVYNKKLRQLSEMEKLNLIEKIKLINPDLFQKMDIDKLLVMNSKYLVLIRILSDLTNESLLNIYDDKTSTNDLIAKFYNMLGVELPKKENFNIEIVNDYMSQDLINIFFYICEHNYKEENIDDFKMELLGYKYHLILLSSSIERRMLMTNFLIPNTVKLVDKISIETTGITLEEYIKEFDSSLVSLIGKTIKKALFTTETESFYLIKVFLETLFSLLNNKEYCDIYELELKTCIDELLSDVQIEKAKEIIEVLNKIKNTNINTKENRQYIKI